MINVFNSREIVEELENKKARKKSKKTFYSDLSRNIAVSLGKGRFIYNPHHQALEVVCP